MNIQEFKDKILSLYSELKKEVDGTITSTGVYVFSSVFSCYRKAKSFVDEVVKYAEIDKVFNTVPILHSLNKEVYCVKGYNGGKRRKRRSKRIWNY